MPRFEINCILSSNEESQSMKFNNEWTIRCQGNAFNPKIKIKRRSSDREDSVSGKLQIFQDISVQRRLLTEKTFSETLLPGQSSIIIQTDGFNSFTLSAKFKFEGYVNIIENSDKNVHCIQYEQLKKGNQSESLENEKSKNVTLQKSLEKLSFDFEKLILPNTSSFSDVTLKCGNATIPAHKVILSARSPVFAAMFAHPMKENSKNEVDIIDIDVSTVRALLMYLYTGKTSDITDSAATDLLFAADKYQLQELKSVCSDFLKGSVSIQNVLRILVLGDMMDEDLKSFATDYICNLCDEFSALENTEEWKTLQKERPALSLEILTSMVKSMNEKLKK